MNPNMISKLSRSIWSRWLEVLAWSSVAAALAACGGGGGAAPPRFQQISFDGQQAIRDNVTGYTWAANLDTTSGVIPTSVELLSVADLGKDLLQTNFSFLLNKQLRSSEPVGSDSTRAWVVDFRVNPLGVHRLGGLSDEAVDASAPFSVWRVLGRGDIPMYQAGGVDDRSGVAFQGNLMWSACSVGRTYVPASSSGQAQCSGAAQFFSQTDAQQAARASRLGNFSDWRLPTKQELQLLLALESKTRSLLQTPFATLDVTDLSNPLQYWTSSTYSGTTPSSFWIVDFSLANDWGGVELVPANSMALVRLVRGR